MPAQDPCGDELALRDLVLLISLDTCLLVDVLLLEPDVGVDVGVAADLVGVVAGSAEVGDVAPGLRLALLLLLRPSPVGDVTRRDEDEDVDDAPEPEDAALASRSSWSVLSRETPVVVMDFLPALKDAPLEALSTWACMMSEGLGLCQGRGHSHLIQGGAWTLSPYSRWGVGTPTFLKVGVWKRD